jgi:uncharacterized protein (TIRG00374 family)
MKPRTLIAVALAVVLLWLALRGTDVSAMRAVLASANPLGLLFAALIVCVSYFTRAVRWRLLLLAETPARLSTVFWANMIGYLGNNVLPARAGEVMRSMAMARNSQASTSYILATAVVERVMDVVVLVGIATVAMAGMGNLPPWLTAAAHTGSAIALVGLVVILSLPVASGWLQPLASRLPLAPARRAKVLELMLQFVGGFKCLHDVGRALGFVGLALVIWLLDASCVVCVAHSLHLDMGLRLALVLLAALGIGSAAPSTPGALGIYQFVAVSLLVPFGYARSAALVFIVAFQAVTYAVVFVFGGLGWLALNRPVNAVEA